jgi:hypothetical protein
LSLDSVDTFAEPMRAWRCAIPTTGREFEADRTSVAGEGLQIIGELYDIERR